jgi:hypothetical protein
MSTLRLEYEYRLNSRGTNPLIRDILARKDADYLRTLASFQSFAENFAAIPIGHPNLETPDPHWHNVWLPPLDAISLYAFLVQHRPNVYLEVGSGNSTRFARRAIRDHNLPTKIISIDPAPRAEIDALCDIVIRKKYEDVPHENILAWLGPEDMMFIDNSHRSFQNSDVTVFFTETLPRLPQGMLVGIHDIFLPDDYPQGWADYMYNEQYLLACYMLGGNMIDPVLPCAYLSNGRHNAILMEILEPLQKQNISTSGGAFWFRKNT